MASPASAFSPENANFFRLTKLLLDVGTDILRELLKAYHVPKTLDNFLSDPDIVKKIDWLYKKKRILSQKQYGLLYPTADVKDFDITLLSCLLMNLHDGTPGNIWSAIEKDVIKIRDMRNKLAHSKSPELPHAEFPKEDIKTMMVKMAGNISPQPNSLQDIEDKIDKILTEEIETHITVLKLEWDRWKSLVEETRDKIDEVHEKVEKVNESVDKVDEKVNKIGETVKNIEEAVDALAQTKPNMDRTHDEERLRSNLMALYEKYYTTIPVSPLHEEKTTPLEDLFTDVVMVEETKDKNETIQIPLQSYRDVFYYKDEKVRSIYVLGQAGAGKTVYTKQMVNKWVKTQKQLKSGKAKLENKDEEVMAEYNFLFYVPLRSVEREEKLHEIIYQCVGDDKLDRNTTDYVFENCPDKVLVVCDGLDEVDWFPSRHNFPSFTIVTTTRPWKYDVIKGRSPQKDRVLMLRGLGPNGVEELAQRLRRTYFKDQPESSVENFLLEVKNFGLHNTLNENPLIVVYLLHVWYQQNRLSSSLTSIILDVIECIILCSETKILSKGDRDFSVRKEKLSWVSIGSDRPVCYQYGTLLTIVSEIAFKGLTNAIKEHTLVFSDRNLRSLIGKKSDLLDACLQLGLISKSVQNHILHKEHIFSFAHKLLQEFFMAVHMASNQTSLEQFYEYCNTLDKVLEMSNVFVFTTVLCQKTALELSKHVVNICNRDKNILDFRSDRSDETPLLIRDMTDMYVKCIEEHRKLKPDDKCELYMSDMCIDPLWSGAPNWDLVATLLQINTCKLKSFFFYTKCNVSLDNVNKTLQQLTQVTSLTCLHFDLDAETDKHTTAYINRILTNNRHLCVLHIYFAYSSKLPAGLRLPHLPHLQHLYINNIITSSDFSNRLSAPLALRSLHLHEVVFEDDSPGLLQRVLHNCCTYCSTLPASLQLPPLKQLHYLYLNNIATTSDFSSCLSTLKQLRTLYLESVDIGDTCFDMSQLNSMSNLTLKYVTMSGSQCWRMLKSTSNLPALKELVLVAPNYSDMPSPPDEDLHLTFQVMRLEVNLQNMPATLVPPLLSAITHNHRLEELVLWDINTGSQHVSFNNTTKLKVLKLYAVTMTREAWTQCFASIQMLHHLTELYIFMRHAQGHDAIPWPRLFLSVKFLQYLATLRLENVNIPEESVNLPSHLIVTDKELHHSCNTDSNNTDSDNTLSDDGNIQCLVVKNIQQNYTD